MSGALVREPEEVAVADSNEKIIIEGEARLEGIIKELQALVEVVGEGVFTEKELNDVIHEQEKQFRLVTARYKSVGRVLKAQVVNANKDAKKAVVETVKANKEAISTLTKLSRAEENKAKAQKKAAAIEQAARESAVKALDKQRQAALTLAAAEKQAAAAMNPLLSKMRDLERRAKAGQGKFDDLNDELQELNSQFKKVRGEAGGVGKALQRDVTRQSDNARASLRRLNRQQQKVTGAMSGFAHQIGVVFPKFGLLSQAVTGFNVVAGVAVGAVGLLAYELGGPLLDAAKAYMAQSLEGAESTARLEETMNRLQISVGRVVDNMFGLTEASASVHGALQGIAEPVHVSANAYRELADQILRADAAQRDLAGAPARANAARQPVSAQGFGASMEWLATTPEGQKLLLSGAFGDYTFADPGKGAISYYASMPQEFVEGVAKRRVQTPRGMKLMTEAEFLEAGSPGHVLETQAEVKGASMSQRMKIVGDQMLLRDRWLAEQDRLMGLDPITGELREEIKDTRDKEKWRKGDAQKGLKSNARLQAAVRKRFALDTGATKKERLAWEAALMQMPRADLEYYATADVSPFFSAAGMKTPKLRDKKGRGGGAGRSLAAAQYPDARRFLVRPDLLPERFAEIFSPLSDSFVAFEGDIKDVNPTLLAMQEQFSKLSELKGADLKKGTAEFLESWRHFGKDATDEFIKAVPAGKLRAQLEEQFEAINKGIVRKGKKLTKTGLAAFEEIFDTFRVDGDKIQVSMQSLSSAFREISTLPRRGKKAEKRIAAELEKYKDAGMPVIREYIAAIPNEMQRDRLAALYRRLEAQSKRAAAMTKGGTKHMLAAWEQFYTDFFSLTVDFHKRMVDATLTASELLEKARRRGEKAAQKEGKEGAARRKADEKWLKTITGAYVRADVFRDLGTRQALGPAMEFAKSPGMKHRFPSSRLADQSETAKRLGLPAVTQLRADMSPEEVLGLPGVEEVDAYLESLGFTMKERADFIREAINNMLGEQATKQLEFFTEVVERAKSTFVDFGSAVVESLAQMAAAGELTVHTFNVMMIGMIGQLASSWGDYFIAKGIAHSADPTAPGSGVGMIAAGIALKALGGALKGYASRKPGRGGGAGKGKSNYARDLLKREREERETVVEVYVMGDQVRDPIYRVVNEGIRRNAIQQVRR